MVKKQQCLMTYYFTRRKYRFLMLQVDYLEVFDIKLFTITCISIILIYSIKQNRWHRVCSPGGPSPRSSHQAVPLAQGIFFRSLQIFIYPL